MPAEVRVTRVTLGYVWEMITRNRMTGEDWCVGGGGEFYDCAQAAYDAGEQALIEECNREIERMSDEEQRG